MKQADKQLLTNLALHQDALKQVAEDRFAPAFARTWKQIPFDFQVAIKNYLKKKPGKVFLCYKMDYGDLPLEPLGRAFWFEDFTAFTFLAPFVQHAATIEGVMGVIGHELAHCARRGVGSWTVDTEKEERETRSLVESWGFIEPYPDPRVWAPEIEAWRKRNMKLRHLSETLQVKR